MPVHANRTSSTLAIVCATLGFGLVASTASAGTYECPSPYDEAECVIDSSPVCLLDDDIFVCYLNDDAEVTVVHGYTGDATDDYDYDAWGELDGTDFCCNVNDADATGGTIDTVKVWQGSPTSSWVTTINFTYDDGTEYNLQSSGAHELAAIADGGAGDDVITGSNQDDAYYSELLLGGADDDTISGGDGDDGIKGGDGNDYIYGGDGNDLIEGNDGSDDIYGGDGNDRIEGGAGSNDLYGEADDDTLIGGGSTDVMYGGAGDDKMGGGDGPDWMYGGDGSDVVCGGGSSSSHDHLWAKDTAGDDGELDKLWGAESNDEINCMYSGTKWSDTTNPDGYCDEDNIIGLPPAACP